MDHQKPLHACCDMMMAQAAKLSPQAVENAVIVYSPKFAEFGIPVHDGGTSKIEIAFCPWCGARLPESKRDRWFDELARLGIDDSDDSLIPEQYRSDSWWRDS